MPKSTEAGFKYLLYGAMTSALMLYGFSLLFGFTGTTQIYQIGNMITSNQVGFVPVMVVVILILIGIGFKISAVPFHFWAPDVYEGAPSPVAGFLSTASKAAGFCCTHPLIADRISVCCFHLGHYHRCLGCGQHDIRQSPGDEPEEYQTSAGLLIHCPGGIYFDRYGVHPPDRNHWCGLLSDRLPGDQPDSLRCGNHHRKSYWIRRDQRLRRAYPGVLLLWLWVYWQRCCPLGGIPPFAGFLGKIILFASAIQVNMVWLAIIGISEFDHSSILLPGGFKGGLPESK